MSAPVPAARPVVAAPPEPPKRSTDAIAPATRRVDARPALGETRRLVVGRDISLAGEIRSAERLVVEGRVAANLIDCSALEIAAGGLFHGSA
ncbi:MAG: bactofilin family protein, partial [Kiloniellales bacterium]